ncbi:MAG: L,D-transpeptidase family protein [Deltaproteobacteria bacterium]|nr:L,D-transpeptidase family protein [Deltaproteobacteria bacterium]MBW2071782.1 L,D-transpeptidase family protein [Deltaproteobacteria bacterium]
MKLDEVTSQPRFVCHGEIICGSLAIPRFYERRRFEPAWVTATGPRPEATALVEAIKLADRQGLRPEDYHLRSIEKLLAESTARQSEGKSLEAEHVAELDLLLTDAFLLYGSHLLAGRVNPETIHSEWLAFNRTADLAAILQEALTSHKIQETLAQLAPPHAGYKRLQQALLKYRQLERQGGWPLVAKGATLKKGVKDARISTLRLRLAITGDLTSALPGQQTLFDDVLEEAVIRFQKRNGLTEDGIVGRRTLAALNVPVQQRLRMLEMNMERWRWISRDLGRKYILVNIASFRAEVIEDHQQVLTSKVVVGRPFRRTPVFSGMMTYLVFNPTWNIPQVIAVKDILPKVRQDPQYLARQRIQVFQSWQEDAPQIDPTTVDWRLLNSHNFRYRLVQKPGPLNALGRVKFMFPNKFSVYLHDTPAQGLFKNARRGFSSGCIRIAKPIELATYLLRDDPNWSRQKILEVLASNRTLAVRLPEPMPVHLLYWTAWVDKEGVVNFRYDIYGRDAILEKALEERPPRP